MVKVLALFGNKGRRENRGSSGSKEVERFSFLNLIIYAYRGRM